MRIAGIVLCCLALWCAASVMLAMAWSALRSHEKRAGQP